MRIREFLIRASQIFGITFWLLVIALVLAGCGGDASGIVAETGNPPSNPQRSYTIGKEGIYSISIETDDNRVIPCIVYKEQSIQADVSVALSCDWDPTR
jgi:hypothetical protein